MVPVPSQKNIPLRNIKLKIYHAVNKNIKIKNK